MSEGSPKKVVTLDLAAAIVKDMGQQDILELNADTASFYEEVRLAAGVLGVIANFGIDSDSTAIFTACQEHAMDGLDKCTTRVKLALSAANGYWQTFFEAYKKALPVLEAGEDDIGAFRTLLEDEFVDFRQPAQTIPLLEGLKAWEPLAYVVPCNQLMCGRKRIRDTVFEHCNACLADTEQKFDAKQVEQLLSKLVDNYPDDKAVDALHDKFGERAQLLALQRMETEVAANVQEWIDYFGDGPNDFTAEASKKECKTLEDALTCADGLELSTDVADRLDYVSEKLGVWMIPRSPWVVTPEIGDLLNAVAAAKNTIRRAPRSSRRSSRLPTASVHCWTRSQTQTTRRSLASP